MLETVCYPDMDKDLLIYKINKLSDKLDAFYKEVEQRSVDIPNFMKPIEQRRQSKIRADINRVLSQGLLDYWYFRLLEEQDNGVRR